MHINCNEILAAFLRLQTFGKDKREIPIQLRVDNTTTMYYINHMGGTHSAQMMQLIYSLWDWSLKRNVLLSAEHLPGKLNCIADQESRMQGDRSEWRMKSWVFKQLMELGPMPDRSIRITPYSTIGEVHVHCT